MKFSVIISFIAAFHGRIVKAEDLQSLAEQTLGFLSKYCDLETKRCGALPENLQMEKWSLKRDKLPPIRSVHEDPEESFATHDNPKQPLEHKIAASEDQLNDEPEDTSIQDDSVASTFTSTTTSPLNLIVEDNRMRYVSTPAPSIASTRISRIRNLLPSLVHSSSLTASHPTCVCQCAPCPANDAASYGSVSRRTSNNPDSSDNNGYLPPMLAPSDSGFDGTSVDSSHINATLSNMQVMPTSTRTRLDGSSEALHGLRLPSQPVSPLDSSDPLKSYLRSTVQNALRRSGIGLYDPYGSRGTGLQLGSSSDHSFQASQSSYPSQRSANADWLVPVK